MEVPIRKPRRFSGRELREALAAGTHLLQRYRDAINALNVFPVPDGDTGTNMLLTMRFVDEQNSALDSEPISSVAQKAAHGALLGARGNSGVILSQFLAGFAQGLVDTDACDGKVLSEALACGSKAAYSAVSKPVEGTMLTVIRELSIAAQEEALKDETDVIEVWTAALQGARVALEKTPSQLPVLAEAGVVDAGGQGVVVLLEGLLGVLKGEEIGDLEVEISSPVGGDPLTRVGVSQEFLDATEAERYGYCTQFMIEGQRMDLAEVRGTLEEMGNSAVVAGDSSLIKVHIHTLDPDAILNYGATLGTTSQVTVDDIDQQHQRFRAFHGQASPPPELGVVAVTWGEGFAKLFEELGCHAVVSCDRTMNPSTEELLDAAHSTGAQETVILPNNPNVILAAKQAVSISNKNLHCIPTSSIPQGVASLLAYSPEVPPERAIKAMQTAIQGVKTLEITTAARNTRISGASVSRGQVIGLLEGELMAAGDSVFDVLKEGLQKADLTKEAILTLYWGGDTQESEAQMAAEQLGALLPSQEVELVYGGQPFYHYIASIE